MEKQTENEIIKLIKELNLEDELSLDEVKEIIYNEKDGNKEFNYLVSIFVSKIPDIERANEAAQIISDAWNTFSHKSLGGLSPQEVIRSSKKRKLTKISLDKPLKDSAKIKSNHIAEALQYRPQVENY